MAVYLSEDVLYEVFKYLSASDLVRCCMTCSLVSAVRLFVLYLAQQEPELTAVIFSGIISQVNQGYGSL